MTPAIDKWTRRTRARRGFTLVELVVASASAVVLMLGLMSCFLIAARALEEDRIAPARQIKAAGSLEPVLADLRDAIAFSERTAQAVTFQVPDRDGDTIAETIRYSWSGTAGAPLMMEYNGAAAVEVVAGVNHLDLAYSTRTVTGTGFAKGEMGPDEILVACHEDVVGGTLRGQDITANEWWAIYMDPNLPDGTARWDLTTVQLQLAKRLSDDGVAAVQIRTTEPVYAYVADPETGEPIPVVIGVEPAETMLEEVLVYESALDYQAAYYDFAFETVEGLPADEGVFIVLKYVSGDGVVAKPTLETKVPLELNTMVFTTTDAGGTWVSVAGELLFRAYGVVHE